MCSFNMIPGVNKLTHYGIDLRTGDKGGLPGLVVRTSAAATIGGTVSELTGGKFGNGAVTASFSWLLNQETKNLRKKGRLVALGSNDEQEKINKAIESLTTKSKNAQSFVQKIVDSGEDVYIMIGVENSYNPSLNLIVYDPSKTQIYDGSQPWHVRPLEVGLGHEIIHAMHDVTGKLGSTRMIEENNTVKKENLIRKDYGIPRRERY